MNENQIKFLAAYRECGIVSEAAKIADVHVSTHYRWLSNDEDYAQQFQQAQAEAANVLEEEARRRAVEGVRRYKFNRNGAPILHPETGEPYYEHAYSDSLLIVLLKANNPTKFGDKIEQTHKGDQKAPVHVYLPDNGRGRANLVEG
ncbi:hypothetical protein [Aeoliella mucimassa]|uniref:Terminase small subunit n=1 Tax=Aeoliella mucimassa TaxID=2527972 RepID=A0A518AM33_9BACT|nr:hypothetical protein [Aeoliella mucimassa]QDU55780.1 hypothetical protein Pan181_19760 [Aeoliella mucimassa]